MDATKLNTYLYSRREVEDMITILEIGMFIEEGENLNEKFDIKGAIGGALKSIGLSAHKSGAGGLIGMTMKAGATMGQFVFHAIKAAGGDEESKVKVKELANTKITKEQVLDFLLNLDQVTLHAITGPIHAIDALTGWHIWANISGKAKDVLKRAEEALSNLADAARGAKDEAKTKLKRLMINIAKLFGLDNIQKVIAGV